MSLAALLQRRAVTPVTSNVTTDVTAPGRAITEGYAGYVGYVENSKGEAKTDDAPLKACAPSVIGSLSVDENRQRRTIEIEFFGVTDVTANAGVERHHFWLIRAEHEVFSMGFCPPKTRAEVLARYPGAEVEVLDAQPGPVTQNPVTPAATASLAEIEAWLDAIGETDAVTRNEILTAYGFHATNNGVSHPLPAKSHGEGSTP